MLFLTKWIVTQLKKFPKNCHTSRYVAAEQIFIYFDVLYCKTSAAYDNLVDVCSLTGNHLELLQGWREVQARIRLLLESWTAIREECGKIPQSIWKEQYHSLLSASVFYLAPQSSWSSSGHPYFVCRLRLAWCRDPKNVLLNAWMQSFKTLSKNNHLCRANDDDSCMPFSSRFRTDILDVADAPSSRATRIRRWWQCDSGSATTVPIAAKTKSRSFWGRLRTQRDLSIPHISFTHDEQWQIEHSTSRAGELDSLSFHLPWAQSKYVKRNLSDNLRHTDSKWCASKVGGDFDLAWKFESWKLWAYA